MAYTDEQAATLVAAGRLLQSRAWSSSKREIKKDEGTYHASRISIGYVYGMSSEVCKLLACIHR